MKNLSPINEQQNAFIRDQFNKEYFHGMAQMCFELNIDGNKMSQIFAYEYMKYIYENVSTSISRIMSHTGYKRVTVEKFIKSYNSTKFAAPEKETNVFNSYLNRLRRACLDSGDLTLPIRGDVSCHSLFEDSDISKRNILTVKSVLEVFEKCGFLKISKDHIKFTPSVNQVAQNSDNALNRQFSNLIKDYVGTQIYNKHITESNKTLFSQRILSIDIPDSKLEKTRVEVNDILRKSHVSCFDKVEEYETSDSDATHKVVIQQFISITEKGDL